ncbi:cysteine-rich CWC family protein [Bacillus sp. NEB1478]|uniref:cysteine-rich CWC family protein n=1 Tax=Bacillus sp. NEB1478 TaxID=3073816 RepID=UPI0037BEF44F
MKSNCPICNEENHCAISRGENPETCWCMNVTFPAEVLETPEVKNRCICEKCIKEKEHSVD